MKLFNFAAMLCAAIALAGCSAAQSHPPDFTLVSIERDPPVLPAECIAKVDPKWIEWPTGDLKRSDVLRRDDANRARFKAVEAKRRICAAGVVASEAKLATTSKVMP